MWKLSEKKNLSIMFLLPNLICRKKTYFKGQGYGTLLKQNLEIINNIKYFYFHLTPIDENVML